MNPADHIHPDMPQIIQKLTEAGDLLHQAYHDMDIPGAYLSVVLIVDSRNHDVQYKAGHARVYTAHTGVVPYDYFIKSLMQEAEQRK